MTRMDENLKLLITTWQSLITSLCIRNDEIKNAMIHWPDMIILSENCLPLTFIDNTFHNSFVFAYYKPFPCL